MNKIQQISLAILAITLISQGAYAGVVDKGVGGTKKGVKEGVGGTKKGAKVAVNGTKKGVHEAVGGTKKGFKETGKVFKKNILKYRERLNNGILSSVLLLAVMISLVTLLTIPATNAEDLAAPPTVSAAPSTTNTNIQGRVERVELQEDESIKLSLKNTFDSLHRLQGALHDIVYEITRQQQVPILQPNVVGSMVIPNVPGAQVPIGDYLPPRQQYMNSFARQVQTSLIQLIEQSSSLRSNENVDSDLNSRISLINSDLADLRVQNEALQAFMASPPYENLAIGRVVIKMSDELDQVKKLLKEAERRVGKDIKHDPK